MQEGTSVTQKQNGNLLILAKAYEPYVDCSLDSYYLCSQDLYHTARQLVACLQESGARAEIAGDLHYKWLAGESGIAGVRGLNGLAISHTMGCYFALQVVRTDADVTVQLGDGHLVRMPRQYEWCIDCNRCVEACPTGAIGADGSFDCDKCIRQHMGKPQESLAMFDHIGTRFLGCDECRKVCPHNDKVARIHAPKHIIDLVDNALFAYKGLEPWIGSNLARAKIVYNQAIIVAANQGDTDKIERIKMLGREENFAVNAKIALHKLRK